MSQTTLTHISHDPSQGKSDQTSNVEAESKDPMQDLQKGDVVELIYQSRPPARAVVSAVCKTKGIYVNGKNIGFWMPESQLGETVRFLRRPERKSDSDLYRLAQTL